MQVAERARWQMQAREGEFLLPTYTLYTESL